MKLIDLLVQELPKLGGWPDFAEVVVQDSDSQICFSSHSGVYTNKEKTDWYGGDWGSGDWCNPFIDILADDRHECIVTRKQYEAALAASQNSARNGKGLPPVGMHCEIVDPDGVLMYGQGESGEVIAHVENTAVIRMSYGLGCFEARFLRPSHSEAERKRDAAVEAMQREADEGDNWIYSEYEIIYDAIAAGKIPGVKLED